MKRALIIFVRNAVPGKVKTRLARKTGDKAALKIYNILLQHTLEVTQQVQCDKIVYYSETIPETDIWDHSYQKKKQRGKDLGARMQHAFKTEFDNNYKNVVIIGSDMYHLKASHIKEAFKMMENKDLVIGPATDGGYYLLGMKTLHPGIFKDKVWGTATVLKETLNSIKTNKIHFLEALNDIDTYEDMEGIEAFREFLEP